MAKHITHLVKIGPRGGGKVIGICIHPGCKKPPAYTRYTPMCTRYAPMWWEGYHITGLCKKHAEKLIKAGMPIRSR